MATGTNPLFQQKNPAAPNAAASPASSVDPSQALSMMVGSPSGATGTTGQQQMALAAMLGPKQNLTPFLALGGPEYAEQLDEMEWNPMAVWG